MDSMDQCVEYAEPELQEPTRFVRSRSWSLYDVLLGDGAAAEMLSLSWSRSSQKFSRLRIPGRFRCAQSPLWGCCPAPSNGGSAGPMMAALAAVTLLLLGSLSAAARVSVSGACSQLTFLST